MAGPHTGYMKIKVEGGTAKGGNLCEGCRFFSVFNYQNGNVRATCSNYRFFREQPNELKGPVGSCSEFQPKGIEDLDELKDKAWIIEVSKSRKIGFLTPKEWRERHKDEDVVPNL